MGNSHLCVNSHTTNIQIKPVFKSKGQLNSGIRHNQRIGKEGQGANIDRRRSYLNEEILGATADDIYINIASRISGTDYDKDTVPKKEELILANGHRLRKDAVLAYEIEASYPGDMVWSRFAENEKIIPVEEDVVIDENNVKDFFKMPADRNEFREWKDASVEFIKERYGEENILAVHVHMDEDEPHIHAIGVPIYSDDNGHEKLSYKAFVDGPKSLAELQTDYADHVAYLGYKRGEHFSSRLSNISTKEYKARLNQAVNKEMPTTLEECQSEIKKLRIKNFDMEQEKSQIMHSAKTIQKQRIRNNELANENKELKFQVQELTAKMEEQNRILTMIQAIKAAEELGKNPWSREMCGRYTEVQVNKMFEAYTTVKERIVELGLDTLASISVNEEVKDYPEMIDSFFRGETIETDDMGIEVGNS